VLIPIFLGNDIVRFIIAVHRKTSAKKVASVSALYFTMRRQLTPVFFSGYQGGPTAQEETILRR